MERLAAWDGYGRGTITAGSVLGAGNGRGRPKATALTPVIAGTRAARAALVAAANMISSVVVVRRHTRQIMVGIVRNVGAVVFPGADEAVVVSGRVGGGVVDDATDVLLTANS
jgi:hypothetical protein